ncbi:MAG: HDIG domain-containing protein [Actinobacteria bacterium]|nr:HDIG domain-containing protein [Actinomycetota bacterium]
MKQKIISLFESFSEKFASISQRTKFLVLFIIFLLLNSLFIGFYYLSPSEVFEVGKPAPATVISPRNLNFIDTQATKERKENARKSVQTVYTLDPAVEAASQNKLNRFFEIIESTRGKEDVDLNKVFAEIKKLGFQYLNQNELKFLLVLDTQSYNEFKSSVQSTVKTLFAIRIKPDEKDIALNKARDILNASGLSTKETEVGMKILSSVILPNYLPDVARTEEARKAAEEKVHEVVITRQKGEVIVREGELVTRESALVLKKLGYGRKGVDYFRFLAILSLTAAIQILMYLYLLFFESGTKNFYLKASLVFTILFIYNALARSFIGTSYQYLIPMAFVVVSSIFLLPVRISAGLLLSAILMTSLYPESSLPLILTLSLPSFVAIFLLESVEQQSHIIRSGALLGLITVATSSVLSFLFRNDFNTALKVVVENSLGSFLSVVLSLGLLPFFESVFHATSPLRLVELSSPSQPLLKELMMKAPGTYNHSVMTANLAEAAAHAVGANPLLTRVASYFHDIGKIKRPVFFVENQIGIKNPHDETNPSLSKIIISSHVRDGIEIARKHGLPDEIIDIIAEHHGTTLMYPIYKKALEEGNGDVEESAFRYQYRKPRTKEAAIVMLADSVEAASRTVTKKTPEKLEKLINNIIKERLNDGQLDEAPITLSDLMKISRAFTNVLSGLYHERIEYPNYVEFKKQTNGNSQQRFRGT